MTRIPLSHRRSGISLLDLVVTIAIIALLFGIGTPYLFGSREKALLTSEQDRVIGALQTARQQSIRAYEGQEYSVALDPTAGTFTIEPGGRPSLFAKGIETPDSLTITFEKLTGKPINPATVTLSSSKFTNQIIVNSEGVVTGTIPEKK